MNRLALHLGLVLACATAASAADDVLVADFEQETYDAWQVDRRSVRSGACEGNARGPDERGWL